MSDDKYYGDRMLVSIFSQPWPIGQDKQDIKKNFLQYEDGTADADVMLLKETFEGQKNIVVEYANRRKGSALEEYIKQIDAYKYDKFIFVYLTYKGSDDGLVHVQDTQQYQIDKTFDAMTKNPQMGGKPKLVLIQSDDLANQELAAKGIKWKRQTIPSDVDRLVLTSTIPQKVEGNPAYPYSLMIRAFCDVVKENRATEADKQRDMNALTIDINNKVKQDIDKLTCKDTLQVPLVFSSLTRFMMIQ